MAEEASENELVRLHQECLVLAFTFAYLQLFHTPSSISAILGQLACLEELWISRRLARALACSGGKTS